MPGRGHDGGMVRAVGLDDDQAGLVGAARPPRDLGEQLEGALHGAEVGPGQPHIGVHHPHQRHAREVQALRHHLRAHEHLHLAPGKGGQDLRVGALAPNRVSVHPRQADLGEPPLKLLGDALGAQAQEADVVRSATVAALRHGSFVTAVVAEHAPGAMVVGERDAAVRALQTPAAVATGDVRGEAATVEEKDDLLAARQDVLHGGGEGLTEGASLADEHVPGQIHDVDLGQGTGVHALGQLEELHLALGGAVVGGDVGRGATQHQDGAMPAGQLPGHGAAVVARHGVLLVGRLVLLVHDDEAHPQQGREERRARPHGYPGLTAPEALPLVKALALRQGAVQHRHLTAEARRDAPKNLGR